MIRKNQKYSFILVVFFVSLLWLPAKEGRATSPTVKIVANPVLIEVSTGVTEIEFTALTEGMDLEFHWQFDGPGELEVHSLPSYALYRSPDKVDRTTTVLITVKVTDKYGHSAFAGYPLVLVTGKKRTITPWVIGTGTAAALGTGMYFLVNDDDNDSDNDNKPGVQITYPVEGSFVERIENVMGTAQEFTPGDQVVIIVIPQGDQEYEHSTRGRVDENGNWLVEGVVFGREGTLDSGRNFDIRAELRDEPDQTIKATDSITVSRR